MTESDEGASRHNDARAGRRPGEQTLRDVMTRPYDRGSSPYNEAGLLDSTITAGE